jgi:hypothetical protein
MRKDEKLIEDFVACSAKLDEMRADEFDAPGTALAVGGTDAYGHRRWKPVKSTTERSCLEPIYAKIPARLPPLYEHLVLSYRWAEVDLDSFRLLANPPGPDLLGLFGEMTKDAFLSTHLLKSGFIPFGKGPGGDYDPVCFDLNARKQNAEYGIVKLDHEEILCFSRAKIVAELAPTFRQLVRQTIDRACKV